MPSGKQSKRQRREAATRPVPPPVRSTARGRRASPRVLIAVGVVVLLAVVGAVLGVVLSGGSSKTNVPARGSLVNALPAATDINTLLSGIPQQGNVLGRQSAPATMVEYVDYQCPYCRQFETDVMPTLVSRYVRPGKLRVELRPVAFIGPDSVRGRNAAIAAARQNRMFNFSQLLYANQGTENTGWLDEGMVEKAAASIPALDVRKLLSERNAGSTKGAATGYDKQAEADQVRATPTILVGKTGSKPTTVTLRSPSDAASVDAAIAAALK